MATETDRYRLPASENERIFRQGIVPDLLASTPSQRHPVVVFLIGQQGASKSTATRQHIERMGNSPPVIVDADLVKPYHPKYARLLADDGTMVGTYTRADAWQWIAQTHNYIRKNRKNALVHNVGMSPEHLATMMNSYRDADYRVEATILAVPRVLSRQAMALRYHEQVVHHGHGTYPVPERAEAAYQGIPAAGDLIDQRRLTHQVTVLRRGTNIVKYRNTLNFDLEWLGHPRTRDAIERERAWPLSTTERASFDRTQKHLWQGLPATWHTELRAIDTMAAELSEDTVTRRSTSPRRERTRGVGSRQRPTNRSEPATRPGGTHPGGRTATDRQEDTPGRSDRDRNAPGGDSHRR